MRAPLSPCILGVLEVNMRKKGLCNTVKILKEALDSIQSPINTGPAELGAQGAQLRTHFLR